MNTSAAAGPVADAGAAARADTEVAAVGNARCGNCGAAVPGRYCAACGQRLEPPLQSLRHFTAAAVVDLTHADSRLWRTLGMLLFRPGHLTREFLDGRRARYLPPVRLYLVLSVAFFVLASLRPSGPIVIAVAGGSDAESGTSLRELAVPETRQRAARALPEAVVLLPGERRAHARARQLVQRVYIVKGELHA